MFSLRSKIFLPLLVDSVTIAPDKLVIRAQRQIIKSIADRSVLLACPHFPWVLDIFIIPRNLEIGLYM